jgi:transposase
VRRIRIFERHTRNILEIAWLLIDDPDTRFTDLGPDWYERRIDPERQTRQLTRQLERLGHHVTLTPATAAAA